jgi:hypothetical protein
VKEDNKQKMNISSNFEGEIDEDENYNIGNYLE